VAGVGFSVLAETERIPDAHGALRRTVRLAREANRRAVQIDSSKLNDVDRTKRDHLCRSTAMVAAAAATEVKLCTDALRPPAQLPRRQ
jgi:hypothetical protein